MQTQVEYTKATKTKYPETVTIAIAKDANGKANPMTLGWAMFASGSPAMMAVAIAPKRYTAEAIRHSKCFTLAWPSAEMADDTLFFGTKSGRDIDKLAETGTKTQPANQIDCVLLSDAVANFECTLESETVAGDHIIFLGTVVASHVNTENKKRLCTVAPGWKLGSPS